MNSNTCQFCEIISNPTSEEFRILEVSQLSIVLLSKSPQSEGHVLIIPSRHITKLDLLTRNEITEIFTQATIWGNILMEKLSASAYTIKVNNLLFQLEKTSGHIDHIHFHIIPRYTALDKLVPQAITQQSLQLIRDKLIK